MKDDFTGNVVCVSDESSTRYISPETWCVRIRRLYRKRTRRRYHAQAALCRDLIERLYEKGVDTV